MEVTTRHSSARKDESPLIDPGTRVFVESPPAVVIAVAAHLTKAERRGKITHEEAVLRLHKLCLELCGTFSLSPTNPLHGNARFNIPPVMTTNQLTQHVSELHKILGLKLIREVIPLVYDLSGSPRESFVGVALFAPPTYGGLQLGVFSANEPFALTQEERRVLSCGRITPDFQMKALRIVIEYNGYDHELGDGPKKDRLRMLDYQTLGWRAFVLLKDDVETPAAFNRTARRIVMAIATYEGAIITNNYERLMHDQEFLSRQQLVFKVYGLLD